MMMMIIIIIINITAAVGSFKSGIKTELFSVS